MPAVPVRELIGRLILDPLAQRLGQDGERRARLIMTVVMGASLLKALEAEGEDSGDEASLQRRLGDLERLFEAALSA